MEALEANISDAYDEIGRLLEKIRMTPAGISEIELETDLSEAIWHLCTAWNARNMTFAEMNGLASEDFLQLGQHFPRIDFNNDKSSDL